MVDGDVGEAEVPEGPTPPPQDLSRMTELVHQGYATQSECALME